MTNLVDFLRTAQLGPLRCGLKRAEVLALLGSEMYWDGMPEGRDQAYCWKYGALEVRFEHDAMAMFGLYFYTSLAVPACLKPTGFFPSHVPVQRTTLVEFAEYMREHQIPFETRSSRSTPFVTQAGVRIIGGQDFEQAFDQHIVASVIYACPGTECAADLGNF
jgi:hypothetical protein